jgi:hypothetical protein
MCFLDLLQSRQSVDRLIDFPTFFCAMCSS